jgi:hypothetical protein
MQSGVGVSPLTHLLGASRQGIQKKRRWGG